MNINPLASMPAANADAIKPQVALGAPVNLGAAGRVSFSDLFEQAIEQVNSRQQDADRVRAAVETGASDDVAGAMIVSQKASLAFQSLIQVRNRVVSAYETVFNMPV